MIVNLKGGGGGATVKGAGWFSLCCSSTSTCCCQSGSSQRSTKATSLKEDQTKSLTPLFSPPPHADGFICVRVKLLLPSPFISLLDSSLSCPPSNVSFVLHQASSHPCPMLFCLSLPSFDPYYLTFGDYGPISREPQTKMSSFLKFGASENNNNGKRRWSLSATRCTERVLIELQMTLRSQNSFTHF